MDILSILEQDADELCQEDLEMLSLELDMGEFDDSYRSHCKVLIQRYLKKLVYEREHNNIISNGINALEQFQIVGKIEQKLQDDDKQLTEKEVFRLKITETRSMLDREEAFVQYLKESGAMEEAVIEKNLDIFDSIEKDILLHHIEFSEEFLDRNIESFSPSLVSSTQVFSEEFFMKHYDHLVVGNVLSKGRNEWRKRNKRSKKLDMFLRVKGVKI